MDWLQKSNMVRKIRQQMAPVEVERSAVGNWKFNYGEELPIRRATMRTFGQFVARVKRDDELALATFAVHILKAAEDNDFRVNINSAFNWNPVYIIEKFNPGLGNAMAANNRKFASGEWDAAPWAGTNWWEGSPYRYIHAVHMSEITPGNIAFADSPAKREAGRYTSMKPGRYLTRYFPELGDAEIKKWAEACAATTQPLTLHFIESNDPRGWVHVYKEGPDSCMQGEECVQVYAHDKSVLRLAYTMKGEEIVGRCIVREDKKEYIRVYPNTDSTENTRIQTRTREMVEAQGYTHGDLLGVRLKALEADGYGEAYYMPYLDTGEGYNCANEVVLVDNDQYFKVVGNGGVSATETSGTITLRERATCEDCDESVDEDINHVEHEGRGVCSRCLDHNYVEAYGRRNFLIWAHEDNVITCDTDGEHYITEYASYHDVYECAHTGGWHHINDLVSTSHGQVFENEATKLDVADGDENEYALTRDTVQTHDGRTIHSDDAVEHGGDTYHREDAIPEDAPTPDEPSEGEE